MEYSSAYVHPLRKPGDFRIPMKIVTLLGSPRSGKASATITNRLTATAAQLDATISTFELNRLSYCTFAEFLEVFWHSHDSTTLNGQGADVGTQYRSAIFCHDQMQRDIAARLKRPAP